MLHLRDSRDFGPVPTSFKMMKRLYDNDNVFQDLESHLATLTLQVKGNEFPNACVGALSLLYKWFPHMLKELEGDFAGESFVNKRRQDDSRLKYGFGSYSDILRLLVETL